MPPVATRQKRALIAARQRLVGLRVSAQNRLRALFVVQGLAVPRGAGAWSAAGLAVFEAEARPLAECGPDEAWRGLVHLALAEYRQLLTWLDEVEKRLDELGKADAQVQRLRSTPGVGPRTAEVVAAFLHEPKRFRSGKQVSAYAGLVPRQYQSGESDRRGRITRRGPGVLRKLLVECAWVMLRYNAWARGLRAAEPGEGQEEAGDRGAGEAAAGPLLGDDARRGGLARAGAAADGRRGINGLGG